MQKFGIDVSYAQAGINFNTVKNEGVEFVLIRGGSRYSSNKELFKDSQFENHYKNAKENGFPVGCYFYSRATSYNEGVEEANYLYNNCLVGKQFEYPIWLDVEDTYYMKPAGKDAVSKAIEGFCETLENLGYYVGFYCNVDWARNYINYTDLRAKYDFWLAAYFSTKPSYNCGIWQFGGGTNKIRCPQIAGYTCDQDYAYKDYPSIMKNAGLNGYPKPVAEPPVEEVPKEEPTPTESVEETPVVDEHTKNDTPQNTDLEGNTDTETDEPITTPISDETNTEIDEIKSSTSLWQIIVQAIINFIINLLKGGK